MLFRSEIRIVIAGAGAAGSAVARILRAAGARQILVCDRRGIIGRQRLPGLDVNKTWLAQHTNPDNRAGRLTDAVRGAHLFIGVSAPGVLSLRTLKTMARHPIVFAMANPTPEIMPEQAARYARIVATGRSDYPNQVNNALGFPGIFRGALDARARTINEPMKLAAARALAGCIPPAQLNEETIVPSIFNKQVVHRVARAVEQAAHASGVAKRRARG